MRVITIGYQNSKIHYPALDGLRGLAVISVILYHVLNLRVGWMGVDLFFVLSGFLITSILIDTKNQPDYFKNFYLKRFLRIFPLYYLVLIVFFLPFFIQHSNTVASISLPYFTYLQNIVFTINNYWPVDSTSPLNHFWSLAIEEQFYLFFPFIVYFTPHRQLPVFCICLVLLSLACRLWFFFVLNNRVGCYVFTFCRMDSLLIGALACIYARKFAIIQTRYFWVALVAVVSMALVNMDFSSPLFATVGFTINAIVFAYILLFNLSGKNFLTAVFTHPVARHFGKYSYGLYVFHHIYLVIIDYMVVKHFKLTAYSGILIPVITLSATYITALLSFQFYENPILKLKKKLIPAPVVIP